jgi:hypothetical protein
MMRYVVLLTCDWHSIVLCRSTKFANDGFIKLARGYKDDKHKDGCAHIACCGWVPCYGDCPTSE